MVVLHAYNDILENRREQNGVQNKHCWSGKSIYLRVRQQILWKQRGIGKVEFRVMIPCKIENGVGLSKSINITDQSSNTSSIVFKH
jgi:hypothetical protein